MFHTQIYLETKEILQFWRKRKKNSRRAWRAVPAQEVKDRLPVGELDRHSSTGDGGDQRVSSIRANVRRATYRSTDRNELGALVPTFAAKANFFRRTLGANDRPKRLEFDVRSSTAIILSVAFDSLLLATAENRNRNHKRKRATRRNCKARRNDERNEEGNT